MTRWARGKPSKLPHEASKWKDLKQSTEAAAAAGKARKHPKQKQQPGHAFKAKKGKYKARSEYEEAFLKKLHKANRGEDRRQKRVLQRLAKLVCFNCREPGHKLNECPQLKADTSQGTGICFKCGSTEHISTHCTAKVAPGTFPFAKCFICKKQGHLSRDCPDNDRGLYPHGGGCNECGSVKHFKKDCPQLLKQQGIRDIRLAKMDATQSADADTELFEVEEEAPQALPKKQKKKNKVVKF